MSKTYVSASLRRTVCDRANGCCEYCLIPEKLALSSHQVDHIIAEKHRGETVESNLALSCSLCNKNKGSDIASIDPETREVVRLYNPRKDRWADHFQLQTESGTIEPLTAIGRVSVYLLQVNRAECLTQRKLLSKTRSLTIPD
ncbi:MULTISPECIES: HNH endonuclease signature motif containing protein [unclassified Microcoleus]|uniref:HNH endonuclease n=1 Tax=unclassified Microcoleus TaxID=2642155 RepID=UPI002FD15417